MSGWELTQKEIDKLWGKYEEENPDQGGLDTWDKRLIKAALKKLVKYFKKYGVMQETIVGKVFKIGLYEIDWHEICKGVGL